MTTSPPIAIVGMSSLFAGSQDLLGFWRDIVSATDRLTEVPPHAWLIEDYYDADPSAPDMTYAKRGGFLDPVPFNPMEFGLPPTTIPATDTAQLLALIAAKRVLDDAGRFGGETDHSRTSVILGVASATELVVEMGSRLQHPIWRKALRDAGLPERRVQEVVQRIKDHYQPWQESTFPGLLGNVVAGRIANRLNLGGSNFVTDAACASSISALQAGLHELYLGDSDMVIAGGVDALNDILMYMCFSKTPAFSATGDCRPFSDEADGTLIGEGVGMLALRRLEDAERDGDPIYAVIRGLGASSDGKGGSVYAPRSEGQAKALRRAYEKAGYGPATVELVEAHGTATKAGDVAEVSGLTSVFGPEMKNGDGPWCALGSVKSQIGHTKAAAGSAGLIKAALALHHKVLPPTLKVSKPNQKLGLDGSPLYVNTEARPWIRGSDHPRRASVSSFGFGGSNFHVTIEEYTGTGRRPPKLRAWSEELVALSAPSREALGEALASIAERASTGEPLARIAHESAERFDAGAEARATLVAATAEELAQKAVRARDALTTGAEASLRDADIAFGLGAPKPGKLAFLFPGQGSQYVGMGSGAARTFDVARAVWDEAADLDAFAHARLDRIVFPPPAFSEDERAAQQTRLTAMENAQPAIAAVSLGYLRLLRALGVGPDAVAGHSFGELTALAAAGRIPEESLLTTARRRGELMAEAAASRAGAMLAVASDATTVARHVQGVSGVVIANDNAPSEVVLAGSVEAIEAAHARLKDAGLGAVRLPVASAFHSPIVADSCEPFHDHLASVAWSEADTTVWANKSAAPYPADGTGARRLLADQLASPVRFREMVEAMHADGVTRFVEVGPGKVLTKLVGRCLGERPHLVVALDDKGATGLRPFLRGLGRLAADGVAVELSALAVGYRVPDAPAPASPFQIMITGFNHDRPYPPANGAAGVPGPNPDVPEHAPTTAPAPVTAPFHTTPAPAPMSDTRSTATPAPALSPSVAPAPADATAMAHIHHATIEAHRRYQELMAESHRSFLAMASQAMGQLTGVPTSPAPVVSPPTAATPSWSVPVPAAAPPAPLAAAPPPAAQVTPAPEPSPSPVRPTPAREPLVAPEPAAVAAIDTTALALEVVSEKTGYPVDMLDLDMEMEAGLGIDSIKQVEILSELQARIPGLPEIAPSELATMRTLRDVADKLRPAAGGVIVPPADNGAAASPASSTPEPVATGIDTTALALQVVSEKTGYPIEMLDLDMEMEAGLGIDSIKQVEILSELQSRVPGLPEIAPSELTTMRTLRDVADKLRPEGGAAGSAPASAPTPALAQTAPATPPAAPALDTTALALQVVAEKTGYPVEMLDLDMEMEAGLGIDSIKQVEILSALQEHIPGMPEIAPSELATLRTLRDVADKLRPAQSAPDQPASAAARTAEPTPRPRPSIPTPHPATPVAAFVPRLVPELRPGFGLAALWRGAPVQITDELPMLANELARGLNERGVSAEVVSRVTSTAAVISLAGLVGGDLGPEASLAAHTGAIQAARTVAKHPDPSDRLFVTIQSTGGSFGLEGDPGPGAWLAGLPGIVKTAAREWPGASLKAIDIEDPSSAASEILDELFYGGPALEVGIAADGARGVVRIEPLHVAPSDEPALSPGSVVVVSGGARGVTASSVARLAEAWGLRLALLGRSQLGEWPQGVPLSTDAVQLTGALAEAAKRAGETIDLGGLQRRAQSLAASAEVRMSLADLDARGIETLYLSADVTDRAQVGLALDHVRETWGPIAGIVHGAGVLRDKAIAEITPDRVADVFAPKVTGLSVLLDATQDDPIEVIALFSSIAARAGNAGQVAYAAANEVLNKVAAAEAARRGSGCRVRSYNWGPWAGGMVDAGLAAHFEKQGIALLSIDSGTQFFVDELGNDGAGVERVVLASPSFPKHTHRLTIAASQEVSEEAGGWMGPRIASALVADLALRLGQALKPVHTMRAHLEDFVIGRLSPAATTNGSGVHVVDIVPVESEVPGYRMIFRDADGRAHHETLVRYSEDGASPPLPVPSGGLEPWPIEASAAYETVLSRDVDFQSIEELEGVSEEGGMALLRSARALGWPAKGFADGFDPAALDGLLQLGTLWTHHRVGAMQATLARMGSIVVHHLEAIPERLRSAFRARRTPTGTLFDFILATEEGDVVAELREVEFDTQSA